MNASKNERLRPLRKNQVALAFSIAGLVLALPSSLSPFVTLNKFGSTHICFLINTSAGLWQNGRAVLGGWVLVCGMMAPLCLLLIVAAASSSSVSAYGMTRKTLLKAAKVLSQWAMPEVLALGVLVSIFKVRDLVNVRIGPGFWCYLGAALMLLLASHCSTVDPGENSPEVKEL